MSVVAERLRAAPPRSWLFVPALKAPEWIEKAAAAGADAIIVDLEDATAPGDKDRARDVVRGLALAERERPLIVVRVNAGPERRDADVAAAVESGASAMVLPKADSAEDVLAAVRALGAAPLAVIPMIESAGGLLRAAEIAAAHERVGGLAFGSWDFAADIGATPGPEGEEVAYARAAVVVAAGSAGVGAIDTPWLELNDHEGAGRDAERARRLGYVGKMCVHPGQVGHVNRAFTPSADEVRRATGIVDALERASRDGSGVTTYEGRMIDRPLAVAARRVLARATMAQER